LKASHEARIVKQVDETEAKVDRRSRMPFLERTKERIFGLVYSS